MTNQGGGVTETNKGGEVVSVIAPAVAGQVCLHAAMAGLRLSAPLLALELGYGEAATGFLVALFALAQIFLCLPAGRYADKHGLKRPMAICMSAAMLGIGLAAIWPTYMVLCISATLSGGAVGAATIALQRHVGRAVSSPSELRKAFSLLSLAPACASFIGPVLAGMLIDHAGFRIAFATLAALPLLTWLLLRNARDFGGDKSALHSSIGSTWTLIAQPDMRRLVLVNTLMVSSWEFHAFMVPVLGHERGVPASTIGMIMGAFAAAVVFIRISVPVISRKIRDRFLITSALSLAGVVLLVYPLMDSGYLMATCSAILGMALGCVQPLILGMLHFMTPSHRQGEALAVRLMFGNVSSLAIPVLVGAASGIVSVAGVFWLMGAVVTVGSRAGLLLRDAYSGNQGE